MGRWSQIPNVNAHRQVRADRLSPVIWRIQNTFPRMRARISVDEESRCPSATNSPLFILELPGSLVELVDVRAGALGANQADPSIVPLAAA